jgi:hypothetical protein
MRDDPWLNSVSASNTRRPWKSGWQKFKEAAEKQPPGSTARELLLQRVRQAEMAVHLSDWLRSHELHPPK